MESYKVRFDMMLCTETVGDEDPAFITAIEKFGELPFIPFVGLQIFVLGFGCRIESIAYDMEDNCFWVTLCGPTSIDCQEIVAEYIADGWAEYEEE